MNNLDKGRIIQYIIHADSKDKIRLVEEFIELTKEKVRIVEVPVPCDLPHYPQYPHYPAYPKNPYYPSGTIICKTTPDINGTACAPDLTISPTDVDLTSCAVQPHIFDFHTAICKH